MALPSTSLKPQSLNDSGTQLNSLPGQQTNLLLMAMFGKAFFGNSNGSAANSPGHYALNGRVSIQPQVPRQDISRANVSVLHAKTFR